MIKRHINNSAQWQFMRKRKAIVFLMAPLLVFIWLVGWSLCWLGSKKAAQLKKTLDLNELPLIVLMPEKKYST
jgi:lysylphosphatidylglycerol synthetase-like protein (DUF2156 family)